MSLTITWFLLLGAALFSIGIAGVLIRRNALVMFMSIELMLNAVNLTFVAVSKELGLIEGQVAALFVMAAAEVTIGLAIIVAVFRTRSSANVDELSEMKG